jgi:5-methylcytosine-specific restriction endonuclease McrA
MPIRPENKALYPKNWKEIRSKVLARAASCEQCGIRNYAALPDGGKVVLTIAHLDQNPGNNDMDNLKALCQRCHNWHDREWRIENRKLNKRKGMKNV